MNKTRDLVKAVIDGEIDLKSLSKQQLEGIEQALKFRKECLVKNASGMPGDMPEGSSEVIKFDSNGQWSMEKAIKPGPTLNYKEMNKPKQQPESETQTINYSGSEPKISGKQWKSSDTKSIKPTSPKVEAKEERIRQAVKQNKVIDDRKPAETALETMKRRGQIKT